MIFFANGVDFTEFLLQMCGENVYFFSKNLKGWSHKVDIFWHEDEIMFLKKNQKAKKLCGQPFIVKFAFEIYKCEFCSFLQFLQGELKEKVNKLEIESESEGGSSNFGQFLNFQFTTELAPLQL